MKTLWKIIISHIQYRKQILQLAKTDLIKTYRGALLSWGWAILKPAITIAVYYFAFMVGLRTGKPVKGYSYFLWLVVGFIPWFYVSSVYTGGAYSLRKYAFLVKKIKFPVCCVPLIVNLSEMIVHLALMLLTILLFIAMGAPVTIYLAQLPFSLADDADDGRGVGPVFRTGHGGQQGFLSACSQFSHGFDVVVWYLLSNFQYQGCRSALYSEIESCNLYS